MKDNLRQTLEAQWEKDANIILFVANANSSFPELKSKGKYFWKEDPEELSAEIVDVVLDNQIRDVRATCIQNKEDGPWTETVKVDTQKAGGDIICSALYIQGFRLQDITKESRKVKVTIPDSATGQNALTLVGQDYDAYVFERISDTRPRSVSTIGSGFWASSEDNPAGTDSHLGMELPKMHRTSGMNRGSKI